MRTLCFIAASALAARVAQSCDHDHHHDNHDHHHHIDHLLLDLGLADINVESMMDITELADDDDAHDGSLSSSTSPMLRNSLRDLRRHKNRKNRRRKAPPCKNNGPSPEGEALMDAAVAARSQARNRQGVIADNTTANVYSPIKVYWNVMKAGETAKLGAWNQSSTDLVIAGLNKIYNNTPFQFTLAGMTQTTNAGWFNCTDAVGTLPRMEILICVVQVIFSFSPAARTMQKRPTRPSFERRAPTF